MPSQTSCAQPRSSRPPLFTTVAWILFLCTSIYIQHQAASHSFDKDTNASCGPLKDAAHTAIDRFVFSGEQYQDPWFHDAYCNGLLVLFLGAVAALRAQYPNVDLLGLVREWCWIHGILMFMKATLMVATTVPTPLKDCRTTSSALVSGHMTHFCNDLMFSGHSVLMVLIPFFWHQCPYVGTISKILMWVVGGIGLLVILGTRQHYFSDVLVAVYMALALLLPRQAKIQELWRGYAL